MFRIEKQLVQVASPAQIPLIPVILPPQPVAAMESIAEEVAAANVAAAQIESSLLETAERAEAQAMAEAMAKAEAQAEMRRNQLLQQAQQHAQQQAQQLLCDAESEAQALLNDAEIESQAIRDQAQKEGYAAGREDARQALAAQQQQAQQQISALLQEISAARDEFYHSFENEAIDLALAIAGKISHTVVKREDNAVAATITHALKQMRREGKITIRISEEMYDTFFKAESATFVLGDESVKVAMVSDPLLKEGDILLEADGETINAGVDSQLKFITLAFGRPWEPTA